MRTIVDIPEDHIKALDRLGKTQSLSRAELVRRAVGEYLAVETEKKSGPLKNDIRGLLKNHPEAWDGLDGVEYQRRIRAEWDDRDRMYGNWGLNEKPAEPFDHKPSDD